MGKTIEVATDRAFDQTKTVLPVEVARGVYMENAPSLRALKLMHLMIATAGGRMADDVTHEMRLSDVRKIDGMAHHDQQSLKPLFAELRAATIVHENPNQSRWTIGGLLDEATVDYRHELTGEVLISWSFGRTFRRMAYDSNHWAILDRQAVFHLRSKYSVLLFQHICSLTNLKHTRTKVFTVAELRAVLGISEGKQKRFADLNRNCLQPAIFEINSDLTRLHLTATYYKTGRTVSEVEIAWDIKEDLSKVSVEQDRSKIGRKTRQNGTLETAVLVFPEHGSIRNIQPWDQIARDNTPKLEGGYVPDLRKLADAFRKWCEGKTIHLDTGSIDKTFTTWCKSYSGR